MYAGIVMGLISALFVALFAALNKRYVLKADALTVTSIEMTAGALFLLLIGVFYQLLPGLPTIAGIVETPADLFALPQGNDVVWLLILALGCTLLPFVLSLIALRHLSAYASSLAVNLEPLYAIALAVVFLGEQQEVSASFYVGAALIVTVVLIYPWWSRKGAEPAQ
jgi:drug/metabolite transporter (DMT)-like permease